MWRPPAHLSLVNNKDVEKARTSPHLQSAPADLTWTLFYPLSTYSININFYSG